MSDEDQEMLDVGGDQLSLSDIANINMDDVEEVRFVLWPAGTFHWRCKEGKLAIMTAKGKRVPAILFVLECRAVAVLVDEKIDPDVWVGKDFTHTIFFGDTPADDLGRAKALMSDAGFKGSGTLEVLLNSFVDTEFLSPVKHTIDKDDKDIKYANLVTNKVAPVQPEVVAA